MEYYSNECLQLAHRQIPILVPLTVGHLDRTVSDELQHVHVQQAQQAALVVMNPGLSVVCRTWLVCEEQWRAVGFIHRPSTWPGGGKIARGPCGRARRRRSFTILNRF